MTNGGRPVAEEAFMVEWFGSVGIRSMASCLYCRRLAGPAQSNKNALAPWEEAGIAVRRLASGAGFCDTQIAIQACAGNNRPAIIARPTLRFTVSGAGLAVVSWAETYTGFELQSASDLRLPLWQKSTDPDELYDGFHHVTVGILTGTRFFRLEKR